jgi:sulfopyruvate decarboxylase subunit alpha
MAASQQRARPGDAVTFGWQQAIADAMHDAGVETVAYVPDARLRGIVAALLADGGIRVRALTREEECIAYAAGFAAAGGRPVVMMQCSGLGNSLNAIGSLAVPYGIAVPMIVSMRGTLGEANPSQVPMGRATTALLGALGIQSFPVASEERARSVTTGVLTLAYEAESSAAVILEPELGGQREGG